MLVIEMGKAIALVLKLNNINNYEHSSYSQMGG